MENRLPTRLSAWLLTLVMLLSLVPAMGVTASAADDTSYELGISDYESLATMLKSTTSRNLKLEKDINYRLGSGDNGLDVWSNQKLDLNGHKIKINAIGKASFFALISINSGEFTLCDSKGGGEIAVEFAMDGHQHSIIKINPRIKDSPPKFTMNGGTLTRLSPQGVSSSRASNGCISDSYEQFETVERPQITINGGTINCPYSWDRSKPLLYLGVYTMPLALQLRYSNLTVNGGNFNGIVWTDMLTPGAGETEPRIFLNGGVFNYPFVVKGMQKDATQIVIDGARFNDGFHVGNGDSLFTDVGTVPALLLKSGVFNSPDQNPKLDIYNVTAARGYSTNDRNRVIFHAMKCFPNSAIKLNGKIYTSENIGTRVTSNDDDYYLNLNSDTPIEVIGRAWDLKEVLLDGSPIAAPNIRDGAAFMVAGSVPVYTVSTLGTHELVYRWYDLAKELRDAGWYYDIECGRGPGLPNIYNGSYTTANGICEWRYRLPNKPANINEGQTAFTINLRHATAPTSIVYSNQYLLRYQVVKDTTQPITAGRLNMSGGDIIASDAVSANKVSRGARENRFTVYSQSNWSSGSTRSKTVTLKAADGYRFTSASDFSVEGANCVTAKISSVSNDAKTCTVRLEARVCSLLTDITGTLENFYDGRTFADVSISSGESDKYSFEIEAAVERGSSEMSPENEIEGNAYYYFFFNIYPKSGYAVRRNSKVTITTTNGYWSGGSRAADRLCTAIYGDWVADDLSNTGYPSCWCLGRDETNTGFVGIDSRYESAARKLYLGVKTPVAGESPTDASYQSISSLPSDVKVKTFKWKTQGDTVFQAGKKYELEISLEIPKQRPNTVWPKDMKTMDVYINGVSAWENASAWRTSGSTNGTANADTTVYNWSTFMPYTVPGGNDGVTVSGKLTSYNPNNATTVQLMQGGKEQYKTTIAKATGSGQVPQSFSFPAVTAGTYDLVVTKPGHLTYTVKNVKVGDTDLDLTKHTNAAISTITLLCGDINGDGSINEDDVSIIRYANNINKSTAVADNKLADINGDGSVNEDDVSIVRYSSHINKGVTACTYSF